MAVLSQIPTTVVTGFLGSGKTTIILKLVEQLQSQGQKVVYLKNEVGQADVDAKVMRGQNILSRELLNGCICCTLVGPFVSAINEVIDSFHPDRIIIESAGTADPAALALTVAHQPRLLRDGVIAVIDVVNFEGYQDISEAARRQATLTDLIVFNKVELVDDDRKRAVVGYVRELNEASPIVEAPHGQLDPRLAFGIDSHFSVSELESASDTTHDHEHEDEIEAITVQWSTVINQEELEKRLAQLPAHVFRLKGFVQLTTGWCLLNGVFKRFDYLKVEKPSDISHSTLICIGHQLSASRSALQQLFHF